MLLLLGDCLGKLKELDENSVDCIVTDPPYGLSFMANQWDKVPQVKVFEQCFRVLKPAGFAFLLCTPRQDCLMQMLINLKEAGFNISFTSINWCYGSGFPKAYNISKGIESKIIQGSTNTQAFKNLEGDRKKRGLGFAKNAYEQGASPNNYNNICGGYVGKVNYKTSQAKEYDGWYAGFQPKPAYEPIIVCQKPMSEKTYVAQALASLEDDKIQKGCVNFDECRIPTSEDWHVNGSDYQDKYFNGLKHIDKKSHPAGRFPANILCEDRVLDTGLIYKSGEIKPEYNSTKKPENATFLSALSLRKNQNGHDKSEGDFSRYFDLDTWFAERIKKLPSEQQRTFPNLVVSKPYRTEKNTGCHDIQGNQHNTGSLTYDDVCANCGKKLVGDVGYRCECETKITEKRVTRGNFHPTVKPVKLMLYLITLACRQGETVLDPFMGSGTTGVACRLFGAEFIGIEKESDYMEIAKHRIDTAFDILKKYKTSQEQDELDQIKLF